MRNALDYLLSMDPEVWRAIALALTMVLFILTCRVGLDREDRRLRQKFPARPVGDDETQEASDG